MTENPRWQVIPVKLSQAQFEEFVLPHLSTGRRGPRPTLALHKTFNYILQVLYMGCQWKMLPIERNAKGLPEIHYTRMARFKAALPMRGAKIMRDNVAPFSTPRPHESICLRCPHKTGYQRTQDDGRSSFGGRRTGQRPGRPAWREPPWITSFRLSRLTTRTRCCSRCRSPNDGWNRPRSG
jgi:hypothetical protein